MCSMNEIIWKDLTAKIYVPKIREGQMISHLQGIFKMFCLWFYFNKRKSKEKFKLLMFQKIFISIWMEANANVVPI